ncbi:polysaccharide deacetylase [Algoriphagus ratkowskyi]|uniref:Polysaccharide deacetylase n=1 Tax=Algoriphagus ratkowskyi TaxID=57028 RepID=A0A2W7QRX4_9BACT|nr:polysaccharide deacetylase family protein [Algoriphagus ratkowskyi]PZX49946.1 polysaccharide deacetylase [Algoriphagus ratkowskyi]TXD75517.1 polysaccharide deacetylase family protein [Algoriphagus ratkowskyi]
MNNGIFTISLDFELLWGIFDKVGNSYKPSYFQYTRLLVLDTLETFAKNEIKATWATVGMLFAQNEEEWKHYSPIQIPSYRDPNLSAYEFVKNSGLKPEVHFAPELIQAIIATPGQELGSHTYAHYYTLMRGQSPEQFRQDLQATQKISQDKFGIRLKSLIFPRNHINELYLPICLEEGYTQVRSNPRNWYWQETQHEDLSKKWFRSADCFFRVGEKTSYPKTQMQILENEPLLIPASRILRPISKSNKVFNRVRLNRVKEEMLSAAKAKEIYHLWWHPHNFATDPIAAMIELNEIMSHFQTLKSEYGMVSMNMEGVREMVVC